MLLELGAKRLDMDTYIWSVEDMVDLVDPLLRG